MQPKILIIQSRKRQEMVAAEQGEYTRAVDDKAELVFISSLDENLLWNKPQEMLEGVSGVIMGGSGEFDFDGGREIDDMARVTSKEIVTRMTPLVTYILEKEMPLLGICYGHQIVSEVSGVAVVNDKTQNKVGSFMVTITKEGENDELFKNLSGPFMAQYGHKDSLAEVPEGAVVLAMGERCRTSALRYGRVGYTVQFHPELTESDVKWKLQNSPGYLPEGVDISSIVKPSRKASTIIPQFIQLIISKHQ